MKAFFLISLLFILSCKTEENQQLPTNNSKFTFTLIDGLGTVSMDFPDQTDTFFSWIQRSDCGKPCEHGDYRFQSKSNRIFKESGFAWSGEPEDTVNQLSIYHSRADSILSFDDSLIFQNVNFLMKSMLSDVTRANILSDTLIKIDDRNYYVFRVANFKKGGIRERKLIAFTTISGTILEFEYKLLTKNYDAITKDFFDTSLKNLYTVKLKDGS